MIDPVKVCVDKQLPYGQLLDASTRAIAETAENLPTFTARTLPGVYDPRPEELAILTGKKWRTGRTISIRFLGGSSSLRKKVEDVAKEWEDHANINLNFGDNATADIRINFATGGSWSYLGTDALSIPQNEATMNYGWLTDTSSDDEVSRVVLHEFGHALSAIHEHQSPEANIPWDKEAVYAYYGGPPNNWTRDQIDRNIFAKYATTVTNASAFDPKSIMLYAIPNHLTVGDYEVGWNRVLSPTDKSFMHTIYPHTTTPATELTITPPYARAAIGAHGEQDLFTFVVSDAGDYSVETFGQTDVVMALLGPDTQTTLVAEDDDSGAGSNARIAAHLAPGRYYVRVRHYQPTGTGDYQIAVHLVD